MKLLVFILSVPVVFVISHEIKLTTVFEWKYVDFVWNSPEQKQQAIDSGDYNRSVCVLYDIDRALDGRYFVTSVREEGVPVSLSTVTDLIEDGGPLLKPYPDWSWHTQDDCSGITNVYRVAIKCNHIFVLDSGQISDVQVCPPKLLIFDLHDDRLVKRVEIPQNVSTNENGDGLFVTPIVHVPYCRYLLKTAVVYMADTTGDGLVVWDASTSHFCRIESTYMKPTNEYFTIENESFYLSDGILGMTLDGLSKQSLFYSPLAGNKIYKMNTRDIKQCPGSLSQADDETETVIALSGQTGPMASNRCALFFSNVPNTAIMCADIGAEVNSNNTIVIVQDSERLQFASGMKIVQNDVMVLTNSFQKVMTGTINMNETNFRILTINLKKIFYKTSCFNSCSRSFWRD